MNLNILAYGIYILVTFIIIVIVGQAFYRNGRLFILGLLHDGDTTDRINHLLLVGYYLFNLGYVLLKIKNWETIATVSFLIESLAGTISTIVIMLSLMHYGNMLVIWLYSRNNKTFNHSSIPNQ